MMLGVEILAFGQITNSKNNPLYTQSFTSINFSTGFTKAQVKPISGNLSPVGITGHVFNFSINRIINKSPSNNYYFGFGLGTHPARVYLEEFERVQMTYFNNFEITPFISGELGTAYRFKPFNKRFFHLGASYNPRLLIPMGYSTIRERETGLYRTENRFNAFNLVNFNLNGGISFKTRNLNFVKVDLFYNLSLNNLYEGNYFMNDNILGIGSGTFIDNGRYFGFKVGYVFSGSKKTLKNIEIKNENPDLDPYEVSKRSKQQIRAEIDARPMSVDVSAGILRVPYLTNSDKGFSNSYGFGFVNQITFQKQIQNQIFEATFGRSSYFGGISLFNQGTGYSNTFVSYNLSFGAVKVLKTQKNKNVFNLHAGLTFQVMPRSSGNTSWEMGGFKQNNNNYIYQNIGHLDRNLSPSITLAISKDIRLANNLFLTIKPTYNQGIMNIYHSKASLLNESTQQVENTIYRSKGSFYSTLWGLKFRF